MHLLVLPCFRVRKAEEILHCNALGSGEWNSVWLSGTMLCYHTCDHATCIYNPTHTYIFSYSVFHLNIGVYSTTVTLCKTCLPYFTYYFTLYYSWTHRSSHSSAPCFLSREWQITPSGSPSLWSPLHVAATIILCTTFKHIPFALQFVQCGIIITTPLISLTPQPHIAASLWVSPTPGLSAPSRVTFCAFYVQSVFTLAKEQSAEAWIVSSPTATLC